MELENVYDGNNEYERGLEVLRLQPRTGKWEAYNDELQAHDNHTHKMLLTEPPPMMKDDLQGFLKFVKRIIVSLGFVVISSACSTNGRLKWNYKNISQYPFVAVRDPGQINRSHNKQFPQNIAEYAIVARCPRNNATIRNMLKPDFSTKYGESLARNKRDSAVLMGLPKTAFLLQAPPSRKKVCDTEKPVSLLKELIETYSPLGLTGLDPFGGTFSAMIACIHTGRGALRLSVILASKD